MTRATDHRSGFTYLEVLLAAAILAATMASMGFAVGHAQNLATEQQVTAQARYLLQDGLAWVRMLAREDPTQPGGFGMEAGESTVYDVDDVDDLAGLVESAPTDLDGLAATADWRRSWTVVSANLTTPTSDATAGSTPLLRLGVTISYQGRVVATETVLLSRTP